MGIIPFDIILFKGTDWVSRIISWATGSVYTHVGVCVADDMTIEARSWYGVHSRCIAKINCAYDVYRVKPPYTFAGREVYSYLVTMLGSRYDYSAILYLAWLKMANRQADANKFQRDKDLYCSELVYEAFMEGGLDIVPEIPDGSLTTPADIANSPVLEAVCTRAT